MWPVWMKVEGRQVDRRKRRDFSAKFKTMVALEALKERKTLAELASEHDVTASQISTWKKQALDSLPEVFGASPASLEREHEKLTSRLYENIGRREMELDWLQKTPEGPIMVRRAMVKPEHPLLTIVRQYELLGLSRATF